jgi:hypothetical protein
VLCGVVWCCVVSWAWAWRRREEEGRGKAVNIYKQARVSECRRRGQKSRHWRFGWDMLGLTWLGLASRSAHSRHFRVVGTDALNQSEPQFPTREISVIIIFKFQKYNIIQHNTMHRIIQSEKQPSFLLLSWFMITFSSYHKTSQPAFQHLISKETTQLKAI